MNDFKIDSEIIYLYENDEYSIDYLYKVGFDSDYLNYLKDFKVCDLKKTAREEKIIF
ncbi:MAG: hypothetical protein ACOCUI_05345 [bacterium]